jgi:hypothetical protein
VILAICLFLYGCSSRCWVCEKEKDSLYIEDYTEESVDVAFESVKGMEDLMRCAFIQYKKTHPGTFQNGYFVHVEMIGEEFVRFLSHNAVLNSYFKICDADKDGFITNQEVRQFNEKCTTKENPR